MNEYLSQIFAAAGGQDIDPEVAAAGALLSKVAEEQGVDLDSFSDDEIGGMLQDIMSGGEQETVEAEAPEASEEPTKSASDESVLTVADVSAELAKTASAEGIDLTTLDRDQYHQAFNWQLEQMQSPGYFEQKVAAEQQKVAMQEKVAEADMLGRVMAHSFNDELAKLASGTESDKTASALVHVPGAAKKGMSDKAKKILAGVGAAGLATAGAAGAKVMHDKHKAKKEEGNKEKGAGLSEQELLTALGEYGWTFE